jgi:hypothetical protein
MPNKTPLTQDQRQELRRLRRDFTLRMLGQNVTFTGYEWLDLLESLKDDSTLATRIRDMLYPLWRRPPHTDHRSD